MSETRADYGFGGFFQLRNPQDLYQKLQYDYRRMLNAPDSAYPAFDFFVTANALVDWTWPSAGRAQQRDDRRADAITRICEHLADGAKHFLLTVPHSGVAHAAHADGPFDPNFFDPAFFDTGGLFVEFEADEAAELGSPGMRALELARRVLIYWGRRMGYDNIVATLL